MTKIGIGLAIAAASATVAAVVVSIVNKHRKEKLLREVYDLSVEDFDIGDFEGAAETDEETDERVSEFAGDQVVKESWHDDYPEEYEGWDGCWEDCGEPDDAFAAYPDEGCEECDLEEDSSEIEEGCYDEEEEY